MILKHFCDNYICRICKSNLKLSRDPDTGAWSIVCAKNPDHYGAWSKRYWENREQRERSEYVEIIFDSQLKRLLPWLPRSTVTAAQAHEELFIE